MLLRRSRDVMVLFGMSLFPIPFLLRMRWWREEGRRRLGAWGRCRGKEKERANEKNRAMGTYDGNPVVEVEYPTAFAQAFLRGKREKTGKKFRFVFLRGAYTVEDQEKSLWFMSTARKGNVSSSQDSSPPTRFSRVGTRDE